MQSIRLTATVHSTVKLKFTPRLNSPFGIKLGNIHFEVQAGRFGDTGAKAMLISNAESKVPHRLFHFYGKKYLHPSESLAHSLPDRLFHYFVNDNYLRKGILTATCQLGFRGRDNNGFSKSCPTLFFTAAKAGPEFQGR